MRFRWPWFVLAVLVIREAVLLTPLNRVEGVQYVYVAALAALIAWTAWHIRLVPGVWVVTAGAALNLVVILANGARRPVAPDLAGVPVPRGHVGQYLRMSSSTHPTRLPAWRELPRP